MNSLLKNYHYYTENPVVAAPVHVYRGRGDYHLYGELPVYQSCENESGEKPSLRMSYGFRGKPSLGVVVDVRRYKV